MQKLISGRFCVADISEDYRRQMFDLFSNYYENAEICRFQNDLEEKEQVIILFDAVHQCKVRGFSTIKTLDVVVKSQPVHAIFSGDTIIHSDFWGGQELMREFCRYLKFEMNSNKHKLCYWLLISKGYKTYRYLPLFFHSFYPCYNEDTPVLEQAVLNKLATYKFGRYYDAEKGIICFNGEREYLKKGVADLCQYRLNDSHVQFFLKKNPGYLEGDELVCLASVTRQNLKRLFFRFI